MAPPLVKGRALLRRRLSGVAFLVVLTLLVLLSIGIYQKAFTTTIDVALETDRAGNQLTVHADVKVRGVLVGEVRRISSTGQGAVLELALDADKASLVPQNVEARLLPKTLFGEKEVQLVVPAVPARPIRTGDRISQDRTSTGLETERALDDLMPLLRSLDPPSLSAALHALSTALRDRGDRLGQNLALNAAYLSRLNPALPTLAQDMQGLADFTDSTATATPDLLATLENLSFSSRSLVQQRAAFDTFLRSTTAFADSARTLVAANEQRFVDLARDSLPSLDLYARYSDTFPCLLNRIAFSEIEGERVFGGGQPGLHITVEVVRDHGPYTPGQEPKYGESRNPHCYGLGPTPITPFPAYINPVDGYNDGDPPEDPGTGPGRLGAQSWYAPLALAPAAGTSRSLPAATTELEAMLLVPLGGA